MTLRSNDHRTLALLLASLITALPATITASSASEEQCRASPFCDGDRVCFIGDSITAGGQYHQYVELYYATRYPERTIRYWNCGVGGDTATAIVEASAFRIRRDILDHRPTVATVLLGVNDIQSDLYESGKPGADIVSRRHEALSRYQSSMKTLLAELREADVRLILLTPAIFDDTAIRPHGPTFTGANDALKACADFTRRVAGDVGAGLVDVHGVMDRINRAEQAANPAFTIHGVGQKVWNDRIHPGPGGHLVIAYAILKAQGLDGPVSNVAVDALTGRVVSADNARVTDVQTGKNCIEFDVIARSLPVVFPKEARAALTLVPFEREFNTETLAVIGLPAGTYRLTIDERAAGDYPAERLAEGVNLANNPDTPQYQQAARAAGISIARSAVGERLRQAATFRYARAKRGEDPFDDAAIKEQLLQSLAHQVENPPPTRRAEAMLPACLENLLDEGLAEQLYDRLGAELTAVCRPTPRHYRVAPVLPQSP